MASEIETVNNTSIKSIEVNPDKIKNLVASINSSSQVSSPISTTSNGISSHDDEEDQRPSKKPKIDASLTKATENSSNSTELLESTVNGITKPIQTNISTNDDTSKTVDKGGDEIPSKSASNSSKVAPLNSKGSSEEESFSNLSAKNSHQASTSSSVPLDSESSKSDMVSKEPEHPENGVEKVSNNSNESKEEDNSPSTKESRVVGAENSLLKGLPFIGSVSISSCKEDEKSDPLSSNSLNSLVDENSGIHSGENSTVQNNFAPDGFKNLGGSSDGAVFPGSASKSESENRTTFDNVLKDKSIKEVSFNDSISKKTAVHESSPNEKSNEDTAHDSPDDIENKTISSKAQPAENGSDGNKEEMSSASIGECKVKDDKVSLNSTDTKDATKVDILQGDDDMHFEELEADNLDDPDLLESEFLLDGDFTTENIDAVLEKIDSDSLGSKAEHPDIYKKHAFENTKESDDANSSKEETIGCNSAVQIDGLSKAGNIKTVNEKIDSELLGSKEKEPENVVLKAATDNCSLTTQVCDNSNTKNDDALLEEINSLESTGKHSDIAEESKIQPPGTVNVTQENSNVTPDVEKIYKSKDESRENSQTPEESGEEGKDTSKEDLSSIKGLKDQSSSLPKKGKNFSKESSKYFREALNCLEKENSLLSLSPKPLKPQEVSASPPTISDTLTVLDSVKLSRREKKKTAESRCSSRGSSLDGELSSRGNSPVDLQIDCTDLETRTPSNKRPLDDLVDDESIPVLKRVRMAKRRPGRPLGSKKNKNLLPDTSQTSALNGTTPRNDRAAKKGFMNLLDVDPIEVERVALADQAQFESSRHLRRIKRKDLEAMVIQQFMDKLLYEHELGHQKDLCKRLEATLEANRKKAAQFHKEVEDLKKVTQRLQAEHIARKNQIVAPVKVKRSVGIQASPTIINKGLATVNNPGAFKIISPSKASLEALDPLSKQKVTSPVDSVSPKYPPKPSPTLQSSSPHLALSPAKAGSTATSDSSSTHTQLVVAQGTAKQNATTTALTTPLLMVNQSQLIMQQPQQGGNMVSPLPVQRLMRAPIAQVPQSSVILPTRAGAATSKTLLTSSAVIDLTDDDESTKSSKKLASGQPMVAIPRNAANNLASSSSGQFVTLPINTSTAAPVNQLLLLPSSAGQPTATLVVPSMANVSQNPLRNSSGGIIRASTPQVGSTAATIIPLATSRLSSTSNNRVIIQGSQTPASKIAPKGLHPAPLPRAPLQQTIGYTKSLPPKPVLKLSHKDSSIILSWNMAKRDEHENIASYQLYAYQEGNDQPSSLLWKRVGSVKALDLPMACTLTQFMPGHIYHFAVRAVDIRNRIGPFSEPRSIRLGK